MNYAEVEVCLQSLEAGDTLVVECDFRQPRILPIVADIAWLVDSGMISRKSGSLANGEFEVQASFDSRCFLARVGCNLKTLRVFRKKLSARLFPNSYSAALGIACGGIHVAIFQQIEGNSYGCYVNNPEIAEMLSKHFEPCEMARRGDAKKLFDEYSLKPRFFRIPKDSILRAKRLLWGRVVWISECESGISSNEASLVLQTLQCLVA